MSDTAITHRPIATLTPWARNARTHSKKQIRQIADSIQQFGFTNPVLIDEAGTILAGHGRVAAATLLGMTEVPCLRLDHMTEDEKRAYVLADNTLALNAGWDEDLLAAELGRCCPRTSTSTSGSPASRSRRSTAFWRQLPRRSRTTPGTMPFQTTRPSGSARGRSGSSARTG